MDRLLKVNGHYRFRMRTPKDLLQVLKRDEIRKSLHTKSIEHAKILAVAYSHQLEKLFMMIRCGMLDKKQIEALVKEFFDKTLDRYEQERAEGQHIPKIEDLEECEQDDFEFISQHYQNCEGTIDHGRKALILNDLEFIKSDVQEFLEEKKVSYDEKSIEFKLLCREMLKAHIHAHEIEKDRILGRYDTLHKVEDRAAVTNTHNTVNSKSITLSQAMEQFLNEKVIKKEFNEKTVIDSQSIFEVLLDVLGDVDISTINKEAAMKFANAVSRLPAHRNKRKEYKGKPVGEVLKIAEERKESRLLSDSSRAKYVERASMLMKWCVDADYAQKNYFKKLSVKYDEEVGQRRPFTTEELMKMRSSPVYSNTHTARLTEKAHEFFIPLIALFTGMRMNEICQLHCDDIKEIDGVWCIDVNKNTVDKRLKSKAARRIVPIHPVLIKAGLIKFKKLMEQQGNERMWTGLKLTKGTYKEQFSKWFARYCDRDGQDISDNLQKILSGSPLLFILHPLPSAASPSRHHQGSCR